MSHLSHINASLSSSALEYVRIPRRLRDSHPDPLSVRDLAAVAPAIVAERPHHSVSDRYAFIPTTTVISDMEAHGWKAFAASTAAAREGNQGFQKHLVRFFHPDMRTAGGELVTINCFNSHNAGASFRFLLGVFRAICANGLVAGEAFADYRIRHTGYAASEIGKLMGQTQSQAPRLVSFVDQSREVELTRDEQEFMGAVTAKALLPDMSVHPATMIRAKRIEDRDPSLWTTTNRIQENVMHGVRGEDGNGKHRKTKIIRSLDRNVKANGFIMTLANEMLRIKTEPDYSFDASVFEPYIGKEMASASASA